MSRRTIRQGIVSRLQASAAVTTLVASASITDSRVAVIAQSGLPAINVWISRTRRSSISAHVPAFRVTHEIAIDCFGTGADAADVAENIDLIAESVLSALLTSAVWVASFERVGDASEEVILDSATREARQGLVRIDFEVQITEQYDPAAADLGSFDGVDLEVDFVAPDGTIEAEINVELDGA